MATRTTGIIYNYFRDYDPSTGRYIESDPIGLAGGINSYSYANDNALRFTDPGGLVSWSGVGFNFGAVDLFGITYTQLDLWSDRSVGAAGSITSSFTRRPWRVDLG